MTSYFFLNGISIAPGSLLSRALLSSPGDSPVPLVAGAADAVGAAAAGAAAAGSAGADTAGAVDPPPLPLCNAAREPPSRLPPDSFFRASSLKGFLYFRLVMIILRCRYFKKLPAFHSSA